jgi:dephospho-CoA kinase
MPSKNNQEKQKQILIGVTGGIGSGKSLVCDILKNLGCEIFYADDITKKLYQNDSKLKNVLYKNFKNEIFENGELSRIKFKDYLIRSKANQIRVNKIVHPFVIKNILELTNKSTKKLIFIEAALIFESGFDKYLDVVILISSKSGIRIERIKKRDNLSIRKIRSIINLQLSEKIKKEKADIVIENNNRVKKLKDKVTFIYSLLNTLN